MRPVGLFLFWTACLLGPGVLTYAVGDYAVLFADWDMGWWRPFARDAALLDMAKVATCVWWTLLAIGLIAVALKRGKS